MHYEKIIEVIRNIERGEQLKITSQERKELKTIFENHGCFQYVEVIEGSMDYSLVIDKSKKKYEYCRELFMKLEERNIPYAVLKGVPLSYMAYRHPFRRISRDIDLLVNQSSLTEIDTALNLAGFHQGKMVNGKISKVNREDKIFYLHNTHQTPPYFLETGSESVPLVEIDINTKIMWAQSKIQLSTSEFLRHTIDLSIGTSVIKTLEPVWFFIELCMHHYKDMNSIYLLYRKKRISLRRYCDIFYFLKNNRDMCTVQKLLEVSNKHGIVQYIYYCIYYCYELFQDDFLIPYLEGMKDDKGDFLIDKLGLDEKNYKLWNIDYPERIFSNNLQDTFKKIFTEKDYEEIRLNYNYM